MGEPLARRAAPANLPKKQKPSKQYDIAYHFEGGFQNRGSTSVCRSKPITAAAAPRYSPAGFPRRAARAHFTHAAANRLPANGPFSLSSSPLRYSARVNAFFLIHLYYSRAGGRSQAKRRRRHFRSPLPRFNRSRAFYRSACWQSTFPPRWRWQARGRTGSSWRTPATARKGPSWPPSRPCPAAW